MDNEIKANMCLLQKTFSEQFQTTKVWLELLSDKVKLLQPQTKQKENK